MKVIANTEHGHLLEVNNDELAQILGYSGHYDPDYKRTTNHIGLEYDISKVVKTAQYVRNLDKDVLTESHKRLMAMADRVNEVRELVYQLNVFEDLREAAE